MTTLAAGILAILTLAAQPPPAGTIHADMRQKGFNSKLFRLFGPNAGTYTKIENEGFHIDLPTDKSPKKPVGFTLRCEVQGDFTLTVSYELLKPAVGMKDDTVCFGIYLKFNSSTRDSVYFRRVVGDRSKHLFSITHVITNEAGERGGKAKSTFPGNFAVLTGKLRMVRQGSALTLSASEGDSAAFQELGAVPVGPEIVSMVRIAADPGDIGGAGGCSGPRFFA